MGSLVNRQIILSLYGLKAFLLSKAAANDLNVLL